MDNRANAEQQEYWNTVAGPRWVGLGGYVERRVRAVNDLLLARSAVAPGERVLEIGCGTGAATTPFAEAVGERGEVIGVDISEPMLAGARKRIAESGLRNVSLLHTDAQTHRFEPNRFDLITSRFGVMFFADPVAAFTNLLPAVRPGGRLCFACWAALKDNRHWLIPYEVILRHLGPPAPKPPRAPGPGWRSATPTMCARSSGLRGSTPSRSTARRPTSSVRPRKRRPSTPASWAPRAG